jgi:hypothetical protein
MNGAKYPDWSGFLVRLAIAQLEFEPDGTDVHELVKHSQFRIN